MKMTFCWFVLFVSCLRAAADIAPTPGTQLIKPVFDNADLVCNCFVETLLTKREEAANSGIEGRTRVLRREVRATLRVRDAYKGPNDQLVFVDYFQNVPESPALWKGETALLFLKATESGSYAFADVFLGAVPFTWLPERSDGMGLSKLQSALATVVQHPNAEDRLRAMRLLQGFDNLDPATLSGVIPLTTSTDPETAFTALAVLLKTKTPESVERLKRHVEAYTGSAEPIALPSIGTELGHISDPQSLLVIEELSSSRYVSIRYGAMDALRLMRGPRSAPVLVRRLDDPDTNIQYVAVITLAEIFEKYEEYAPSMYIFDRNPRLYTDLWKKWWAEQGHRLY